MSGKRLYVGNLAYATTNNSLKTFFESAGEVTSADVVMDRISGRSKGFAFVEMATDAGATAAINQLNGQPLDGRQIRIDEAKPKEDRPRGERPPPRSYGGGGGGGYSSSGGGDRGGYSGGGGDRSGGGRGNDRGGDRNRNDRSGGGDRGGRSGDRNRYSEDRSNDYDE